MPDNMIRERLADALRDHLVGLHPRNHVTADGSHAYLCAPQLNFDILADVLLSLPGIAVVDVNRIREMQAVAARDIERATTPKAEEYARGYLAALRWALVAADSDGV
jgi:hypothetical protein